MSNTEPTVESVSARLNRQTQLIRLLWFVVAFLAIFTITWIRPGDIVSVKTVSADRIFAGTVAVKNNMDQIVALLSSSSDGSPQISLYDQQQKLRMSIALRANGGPSVGLSDPDRNARAVLSLNDRQEPSLVFFDPNEPNDQKGTQRVLLGLDTGGSGLLYLFGRAGALNLATGDGRMKWTPAGGTAEDLPLQK